MKHGKKEEIFGLMVKDRPDLAEGASQIHSVPGRLSPAARGVDEQALHGF